MAEFTELKNRVGNLLGAAPRQAEAGIPSIRADRAMALAAPERDAAAEVRRRFSPFLDADLEAATALADRFVRFADEAGADRQGGLEKVVAEAEGEARRQPPGLVQHALMLFMTHHPTGRTMPIPSLLQRSVPAAAARAAAPPNTTFGLGSASSPPEHRLDWFREDPLANEHHEHWHLVYPRRGMPGPSPRKLRPRHGELFFYMHQQMLARYDAERLAIPALGRVSPLGDYRAPIAQGYDPGDLAVAAEPQDVMFGPRPAGTPLRDLTAQELGAPQPYTVHDHELRRDRMLDAAQLGELRKAGGTVPLKGHDGSDLLGKTEETTVESASPSSPFSYYGNHHGMGHVLLASASTGANGGVISQTGTAIRDPAFWRWHKHIDDINFGYQETQPAHDLASDAPPVLLRKSGDESSDIILCFKDDIAGSDAPDFDFGRLARHAFGDTEGPDVNQNWNRTDSPFSYRMGGADHTLETTPELTTEMRDGTYELTNHRVFRYPYLWHRPFFYAFRVENQADAETLVTVRVFLCPSDPQAPDSKDDAWLNDRRLWIELDKFSHALRPREKAVIARADTDSSIIRRPAQDPATTVDIDPEPRNPDDFYCECGWPYHLLIPRGSRAGMPFRLLVFLTDGKVDAVPATVGTCGSMSFCGARDSYPDVRPMGYPFDRRLAAATAADMAAAQANMAMRSITIRCPNI